MAGRYKRAGRHDFLKQVFAGYNFFQCFVYKNVCVMYVFIYVVEGMYNVHGYTLYKLVTAFCFAA